MGVISTKNARKNNMLKVESSEQFSVWRTTVFAKGKFNRDDDGKVGKDVNLSPSSTHTMKFCSYPHTPTTDCKVPSGCASIWMELKFFVRNFEKCVGVDDDDNDVTVCEGYSLWMTVETDNEDSNHPNNHQNDVIFSVKIKKTVNGQKENGGVNQDAVVIIANDHSKEFLLDENFIVLGFQQRNLMDGKVKKNVALLGDLIKLQVDFAVKILYASENSYGDEIEGGVSRQATLQRKLEGSGFLVKDLKKLYTGEVLTDVVLKASDGMVVKAHKAILAARSPYFCRLIQWNPSSFSGKPTVPFSIDDVSGRPLLAVVHWMYTGELMEDVGLDSEILNEMMKAARKFEMGDLLKILEKRRQMYGGGQCSSCYVVNKSGGNGDGMRELNMKSDCKDAVKKIKRAVLAWFPLLRYRFGSRQVGLVQSIINALYGIYELV